jgi:protocatechuate 3,4-dioxygenase alpha subunit
VYPTRCSKYAQPGDPRNKKLQTAFTGFARVPTDENGAFQFRTIKPGSVPGPDHREQAPHLVISIFMRGLLKGLFTRMYFPGESLNANDMVLGLVPEERRSSLIARNISGPEPTFKWNVILQGEDETVFFDY